MVIGELAPDFTLPDQDGNQVSLSSLRGQYVCMYFYPGDDTPTCTKQSCQFRDYYPQIQDQNCVILGISADSIKSHTKFRHKYDLPFTLLSDEKHRVCEQYGVWAEKKLFDRTYMGIVRTTFLVDPRGKISKIWNNVEASENAKQVYEQLSK